MKRNYFKKSLAILLTLMMVMGTLVAIPLTTGAEDAPVEDAPVEDVPTDDTPAE